MNTNAGFSRSLAVGIISATTLGLLACSNSSDQPPPDTASTDAKSPDPARAMTKKEESTQMPMPGQANDHSNPTPGPVKPPTS